MENKKYEFMALNQEAALRAINQAGAEGFQVVGSLIGTAEDGKLESIVVLQRERTPDAETLPEGQVAKPTRTGLFYLNRPYADRPYKKLFVERGIGKFHYGMAGAPCLNEPYERWFDIDDVAEKWQQFFIRAARYVMSGKESGDVGKEFQFWLPGLTDDEELLK